MQTIVERIVPDPLYDEIIQLQHAENEERSDLDAYDRSVARAKAVREEFAKLLNEEPEGVRGKHASAGMRALAGERGSWHRCHESPRR